MSTSRYSLNSFGESSSTSMASLSSDDYGDRNIFSPGPSSPTYKSVGTSTMNLDREQHTPDSLSPSLSPLPPRHPYSLAHHITMEEDIGHVKKGAVVGSRNRTLSESNYPPIRKQREASISSVASSTDSAKARVYSRNARNLRRAKSCKNTARDDSSVGRQSGSTTSLNKKPLGDTKVS